MLTAKRTLEDACGFFIGAETEYIVKGLQDTLSPKRLRHSLFVAEEAAYLFDKLGINEDRQTLCLAAFVHDCTKELTIDEQLLLCKKYDIMLSDDDLRSPGVIHARTGAAVAKNEFGIPEEMCGAIYTHTSGKWDMNFPQKILYIADFTEKSRRTQVCRTMRERLHTKLDLERSVDQRRKITDSILLDMFTLNLRDLISKNKFIHPDTVAARNFLIEESGNK
ncbi:MAG: HD domain-containing protein [Oscillospiraceae bacterium]|nr:HD domain-containing protein [Oscillospiraceae bacterium]